jgi:indolepyruvate ferredoxin oxidoreductase beta subunit
VILNTALTIPFTVSIGESKYPSLEEILEKLGNVSGRVIKLDAAQSAQQAGSLLSTNIVMLGALFGTEKLPIGIETVRETIRTRFLAKTASVNIKAFDLGYEVCRQALKNPSEAEKNRG